METFKEKLERYDKMIFDAIFGANQCSYPPYYHEQVKKAIKKIINESKKEAIKKVKK